MTVIEPNTRTSSSILPAILAAVVFVVLAASSIYLYNQNVELQHTAFDLGKQAEVLQVANAEYKNKLYNLLDAEQSETLAAERRLIKEKNPRYVEGAPISLIQP